MHDVGAEELWCVDVGGSSCPQGTARPVAFLGRALPHGTRHKAMRARARRPKTRRLSMPPTRRGAVQIMHVNHTNRTSFWGGQRQGGKPRHHRMVRLAFRVPVPRATAPNSRPFNFCDFDVPVALDFPPARQATCTDSQRRQLQCLHPNAPPPQNCRKYSAHLTTVPSARHRQPRCCSSPLAVSGMSSM